MNGKKGNDKYMNKVNPKLMRGGVVVYYNNKYREEEGYYLDFSLQRTSERRFNVRGGLIE
ncbi:MAG: hypothetical protein ACI4VL_06755 [Bacilli bacterium]